MTKTIRNWFGLCNSRVYFNGYFPKALLAPHPSLSHTQPPKQFPVYLIWPIPFHLLGFHLDWSSNYYIRINAVKLRELLYHIRKSAKVSFKDPPFGLIWLPQIILFCRRSSPPLHCLPEKGICRHPQGSIDFSFQAKTEETTEGIKALLMEKSIETWNLPPRIYETFQRIPLSLVFEVEMDWKGNKRLSWCWVQMWSEEMKKVNRNADENPEDMRPHPCAEQSYWWENK